MESQRVKIKIKFKPHPGQRMLLDESSRFNVCNIARRWGKTRLARYLLCDTACNGKKAAYYAPTFRSLSKTWKVVKRALQKGGLILNKDETLKTIELITGGEISFFSIDNPDTSRGEDFDLIIIDEAAMVRKLKEAWEQTIRATLADRLGTAWFFSTPKGKKTFWHDLFQKAKKEEHGYKAFTLPTSTNPHIPKSEIEASRNELPTLVYLQEYEAKFVSFSEMPWFYSFKEEEHIVSELNIDPNYPLYLSFDFNIKASVLLFQEVNANKNMIGGRINFIAEYQSEGGTAGVVDKLNFLNNDQFQMPIIVCGDNNGHRGGSNTNKSDYQIISSGLKTARIHPATKKANALHVHSSNICNTALKLLDIKVSKKNCPKLVEGLELAEATTEGKLNKKNEPDYLHLVDTKRYALHLLYPNIKKIVKKSRLLNAA